MTGQRRPRLSYGMLHGFEAAARRLSFTAAASDLCLTQSAISRQVQTLEEQIGMPLFIRANRALELTEAGRALFAAVQGAAALIDGAVASLNEHRVRAEISVVAAGPFASCWLVPRLNSFARAHPECSVRIDVANEVTAVTKSGFDLAIWHFVPGQEPPEAVKLVDDEVTPVCTPMLAQSEVDPIRVPADLARHVLIQFVPTINNRAVVDWFRWRKRMNVEDLVPQRTMSFSQYDQVVRAALDGNGVALGRLPLVSAQLRDGSLQAPMPQARVTTGAWHAVAGAGTGCRRHVREFLEWLQDEAESERIYVRGHHACAARA